MGNFIRRVFNGDSFEDRPTTTANRTEAQRGNTGLEPPTGSQCNHSHAAVTSTSTASLRHQQQHASTSSQPQINAHKFQTEIGTKSVSSTSVSVCSACGSSATTEGNNRSPNHNPEYPQPKYQTLFTTSGIINSKNSQEAISATSSPSSVSIQSYQRPGKCRSGSVSENKISSQGIQHTTSATAVGVAQRNRSSSESLRKRKSKSADLEQFQTPVHTSKDFYTVCIADFKFTLLKRYQEPQIIGSGAQGVVM